METITIEKDTFDKLLSDIENLVRDVENITSISDEVVKQRIEDIDTDTSIGKPEKDLDDYLKKRGVNINGMGD